MLFTWICHLDLSILKLIASRDGCHAWSRRRLLNLEHLVVLLAGPISHTSTRCMDLVEIFNIILDLSITCFSHFSGCWASFMFIVITLSWNAITCFLESSWVWDRFLLFRPLLIQTLKYWKVFEIFSSKVHQNAISDLQTKSEQILKRTFCNSHEKCLESVLGRKSHF